MSGKMTDQATAAVLVRLQTLIDSGEEIRSNAEFDPDVDAVVLRDFAGFVGWRARCMAFLEDYLGQHVYTKHAESSLFEYRVTGFDEALSILNALKDDIEGGYLTTFRERIHADMFGDFLEMAEYLLSGGFKDPAAVLVGGVLEEHLRQLCIKHGVDMSEPNGQPKKADKMNADLVKKAAYAGLEQKQVTAWLDLRNKAAHGRYSEYREDQVSLMLQGVRDFAIRHPA